jgi:D-glycero-alpha-D-manno-heptose-7-phosphate kinase
MQIVNRGYERRDCQPSTSTIEPILDPGGEKMIGTRTPFRFSFVGGGTDIASFYREMPGMVISATINMYMYIFLHPHFEGRFLIKYSKTELVDSVDEIQHPLVRQALRRFQLPGLDINSISDIPAGTGLGSSSSFTVGLLNALYAQNGQVASKGLLADEACRIEIDEVGEPIGKQDQYAAAYGGLNRITFLSNGSVNVEPLPLSASRLKEFREHLIVFYTGSSRNTREILSDQLGDLNKSPMRENLAQMVEMVMPFQKALLSGDFAEAGRILDEGWNMKRQLSKHISNQDIDHWYKVGLENGGWGGKLLGAGGGGFLLFIAPPDSHADLRCAMTPLKELKFEFEQFGSQLIHLSN